MRGFIEDQRARLFFKRLKTCATPTALAGRKPSKIKRSDGSPRRITPQSAHAPGTGTTLIPGTRLAHQVVTGIGNQRGAGIEISATSSPASRRVIKHCLLRARYAHGRLPMAC